MNNSQALKNLKQSAKKQTEELKSFNQEIHQENWNKLSKDLISITNRKLNKIEQNIKKEISKPLDWRILSIVTISSLIVGLLIGAILVKKYMKTETVLQKIEVPVEKIIEKKVTVAASTDIQLINELNNEIDTLQSKVQDMKKWTIPEKYRAEDEDGIYLRRNKKHIFNEGETDIRWIFIRKVD